MKMLFALVFISFVFGRSSGVDHNTINTAEEVCRTHGGWEYIEPDCLLGAKGMIVPFSVTCNDGFSVCVSSKSKE